MGNTLNFRRDNAIDRQIGQNIRCARRTKKLTQELLGNQLDLSVEQVEEFEQGRSRVSSGDLVLIARYLGVPVHSLYPVPLNAHEASELSAIRHACMEQLLLCEQENVLVSILSILRSVNDIISSGKSA